MNKRERERLVKLSADLLKKVSTLEELALEYVKFDWHYNAIASQYLEESQEEESKFEERYALSQLTTFSMGTVFSNRKNIAKILYEDKWNITTQERKILELWLDYPLRWTVFRIRESQGEDVFTIYDAIEEEELVLYSPNLFEFQKIEESRRATYIALLYFNGQGWQVEGFLHFYQALSLHDIIQYALLMGWKIDNPHSFTSFVQANFFDFFALDEIATTPLPGHRGEILSFCFGELKLKSFDPKQLLGTWEIEEKEDRYLKLLYTGVSTKDITLANVSEDEYEDYGKTQEEFWDSEDMRFCTLYFDKKTQKLSLQALTYSGYMLLYYLLKASFKGVGHKIQDPDWELSMPLAVLIHAQEYPPTPWQEWKELFDIEPAENDPFIDTVNAFLAEMITAYNSGQEFNLQKAAKRHGISPEDANDLQKRVMASIDEKVERVAIPPEEEQYGIDYPVPSPAMLRMFSQELGSLFGMFISYDDLDSLHSFNVLTGGSFQKELGTRPLSEYITQLFVVEFGWAVGCRIMNSFFYLLLHTAEKPVYVRSFSWEIIKLFNMELLGKYQGKPDVFIEKFSRFVFNVLRPNAICEVKTRPSVAELKAGTYQIRDTVFFQDFLELEDD